MFPYRMTDAETLAAFFGPVERDRHMRRAEGKLADTRRHLSGLTVEEIAAISGYTTAGPRQRGLNRALRDGVADARQERFATLLDRALGKLPVLEGQVFRGLRLLGDPLRHFLDAHQIGARVPYLAYTSTSLFPEAAYAGNVFIRIDSATARCVTYYSRHPGEAEGVFVRGSNFTVTMRKQDRSGGWTLFLEEE